MNVELAEKGIADAAELSGIKGLMFAVIHQAIEDFRTLQGAGIIAKDGTVRRLLRSGERICDMESDAEIRVLVSFLRTNQLEKVIEHAGLAMNAKYIRNRLDIEKKD